MLAVSHTTPLDARARNAMLSAGADVFEVDVRLVRDRLVASHYLPLLPGVELLQHHNGRPRLGPPFGRGRDPHLADIVALVPPDRELLLDCKDDGEQSGPQLCSAIVAWLATRSDVGRFRASSKNWPAMQILARAGVRTWVSVANRSYLHRVSEQPVPADGVTVRYTLLDAETVAVLHRSYACVVAWTVPDVRRGLALAAIGVDGLTTDDPAVVRSIRRDRRGPFLP